MCPCLLLPPRGVLIKMLEQMVGRNTLPSLAEYRHTAMHSLDPYPIKGQVCVCVCVGGGAPPCTA